MFPGHSADASLAIVFWKGCTFSLQWDEVSGIRLGNVEYGLTDLAMIDIIQS